MLDVHSKKPCQPINRTINVNLLAQLRCPTKWRDESEGLKSHRNSETDLSSTNSHSIVEDRSISPTEKLKKPFSTFNHFLNPKKQINIVSNPHQPNHKYKTELCKNYEMYGYCKWDDSCFFAHGKFELKSKTLTNNFYKTKICKHFHKTGYCPYAFRCQYFHFKSYQIYQELLESFESKVGFRINETEQKLDKSIAKFERMQPRLDIFIGFASGDGQKSLLKKYEENEF